MGLLRGKKCIIIGHVDHGTTTALLAAKLALSKAEVIIVEDKEQFKEAKKNNPGATIIMDDFYTEPIQKKDLTTGPPKPIDAIINKKKRRNKF